MKTAAVSPTQNRAIDVLPLLLPPAKKVSTCVGALAVRDTGPAEHRSRTIVLWPSILADYRIYRHQIEVWRDRHRIIAVDGPGHGESGRSPGAFSMHDCAQALGQVLGTLSISEPVVVVGTSWGGLVAGEFALSHPRQTLAVVMLNTPIIKASDRPSLGDRFVVCGARWIHSMAVYRNGVAKAFFLPATIGRGGIVQEDFHDNLRQADGAALSQAVRSVLIDREPIAHRMDGIKAPTLFVAGRQDSMYPVDALQRAAQALPNGQFEVLDTAHISVVDDPEAVTLLIDRFLQKHLH